MFLVLRRHMNMKGTIYFIWIITARIGENTINFFFQFKTIYSKKQTLKRIIKEKIRADQLSGLFIFYFFACFVNMWSNLSEYLEMRLFKIFNWNI